AWVAPARRRQSLFGPDAFRFLNETGSLAAHGWDDPALSRLWRYNLHYFDDLNAEGAEERGEWHKALVARWIAANPPGRGSGWEPYPTSLRIVNWIKWALSGNSLSPQAVQSLAVQARWLSRRLEYHLLGNHLFANAKALVFAGCFFDGSEAENWLAHGIRILAREVPEQILPDGGQFELSPMYHALALEDMLDLVNIARAAALPSRWRAQADGWEGRIKRMRDWLATMCHPDGEIAFFNDAAFGIAPARDELELYAQRLGYPTLSPIPSGCRHLADSGYVRLQNDRAVVLIDVARVGPDYLPGHAHADTLSFELSVDGRRVLVNSGTSVYGDGPERRRQRGTAAHNTVVVDGEDSSEVWSGFRVARRARPRDLSVSGEGDGFIVACAHDGYRRLAGRPLHRRSWRFDAAGLVVSDRVEGAHRDAEAAFHFHPDLSPSIDEEGRSGALESQAGTVLRWRASRGEARLEPSTWHPEFGVSLPARRLVVTLSRGESLVEFTWVGD
ncbi:MAG: alginate lyase family protein, partial [Mesorhizobium sp.]